MTCVADRLIRAGGVDKTRRVRQHRSCKSCGHMMPHADTALETAQSGNHCEPRTRRIVRLANSVPREADVPSIGHRTRLDTVLERRAMQPRCELIPLIADSRRWRGVLCDTDLRGTHCAPPSPDMACEHIAAPPPGHTIIYKSTRLGRVRTCKAQHHYPAKLAALSLTTGVCHTFPLCSQDGSTKRT